MRKEDFEILYLIIFVPIWFSIVMTYLAYVHKTSMLMIDIIFTSGIFWLFGITGTIFWVGEIYWSRGVIKRDRDKCYTKIEANKENVLGDE